MIINRIGNILANGQAPIEGPPTANDVAAKLRGTGELLESFVTRYPRTSLISAVALGAILAWWIKRR